MINFSNIRIKWIFHQTSKSQYVNSWKSINHAISTPFSHICNSTMPKINEDLKVHIQRCTRAQPFLFASSFFLSALRGEHNVREVITPSHSRVLIRLKQCVISHKSCKSRTSLIRTRVNTACKRTYMRYSERIIHRCLHKSVHSD